jgi:alternative sigma factor RpoH
MSHMRLVISMAAKFRSFGLPMGDLVQEGHIGLLEAAARFEPSREVRFSTYATWWIRASMQDYVLRNWSIVRGGTSSAQKALFFNLRRLRARLAQGDRQLTSQAMHEEIAAALGVSLADVQTMDARLSGNDASLQAPIGGGDPDAGARLDFLASEAPLPDEQVSDLIDGERARRWLQVALGELSEREMKIIRAWNIEGARAADRDARTRKTSCGAHRQGAGADGVDALKRKASRGHLLLIRMPAPSPRERGRAVRGKFMHSGRPFGLGWSGDLVGLD